MKILLTLLFFVGANFVNAQQLSTFYDATSNNAGFSYNITISYKLLKGWSKARPSEIYSTTRSKKPKSRYNYQCSNTIHETHDKRISGLASPLYFI